MLSTPTAAISPVSHLAPKPCAASFWLGCELWLMALVTKRNGKLRDWRWKFGSVSLTPRQRAKILNLYRRSLSLRQIANAVGVAVSTVQRALEGQPRPQPKASWAIRLPRSLSDAADRARGPLSRSAYVESVLRHHLDAEARKEGP